LVVTGKQLAEVYWAENGKIEHLETIEEPKMQYTDNKEGAFRRMGAQGVSSVGAPYEEKDEVVVKRFMNKMRERLEALFGDRQIDELVLFTPEYIAKNLEEKLPDKAVKSLQYHLYGNYAHHHPFQLLEMIKEKEKEIYGQSIPRKNEARKLMEKDGY